MEVPWVASFVGGVKQEELGDGFTPECPSRGSFLPWPKKGAAGGEWLALPSRGKQGVTFGGAKFRQELGAQEKAAVIEAGSFCGCPLQAANSFH